jgi:hypothetical protein
VLPGENATLSGGLDLSGLSWAPAQDEPDGPFSGLAGAVMVASVPPGTAFTELFDGDQRLIRARWPNGNQVRGAVYPHGWGLGSFKGTEQGPAGVLKLKNKDCRKTDYDMFNCQVPLPVLVSVQPSGGRPLVCAGNCSTASNTPRTLTDGRTDWRTACCLLRVVCCVLPCQDLLLGGAAQRYEPPQMYSNPDPYLTRTLTHPLPLPLPYPYKPPQMYSDCSRRCTATAASRSCRVRARVSLATAASRTPFHLPPRSPVPFPSRH